MNVSMLAYWWHITSLSENFLLETIANFVFIGIYKIKIVHNLKKKFYEFIYMRRAN